MDFCYHNERPLQSSEPLILAGNTASGVYHKWPQSQVVVDVKGVSDLKRRERSKVSICNSMSCHLILHEQLHAVVNGHRIGQNLAWAHSQW